MFKSRLVYYKHRRKDLLVKKKKHNHPEITILSSMSTFFFITIYTEFLVPQDPNRFKINQMVGIALGKNWINYIFFPKNHQTKYTSPPHPIFFLFLFLQPPHFQMECRYTLPWSQRAKTLFHPKNMAASMDVVNQSHYHNK